MSLLSTAKQALEALEYSKVGDRIADRPRIDAITALRVAISEQEKCEPVGYARYEKDKLVLMVRNTVSMDMFPIYTHPAPVEKCDHVPVTTFGGDYCIKCNAPVESNDYPAPVPDGWQLVPVKPTDAMIRASHDLASVVTYSNGQHTHIPIAYKAMLQAAPKPGEMK